MRQGKLREETGGDAAAVTGDDADFDASRRDVLEPWTGAGQQNRIRAAGHFPFFQVRERFGAEGGALTAARRDGLGGGLNDAQDVPAREDLVSDSSPPRPVRHRLCHRRKVNIGLDQRSIEVEQGVAECHDAL